MAAARLKPDDRHSLRALAIALSAADLVPATYGGALLAATEALIAAHRAARRYGDDDLTSLVEAALRQAGRRLKTDSLP